MVKISIFGQNFNIWSKFRFLVKLSIFGQIFDFSSKISILVQNFENIQLRLKEGENLMFGENNLSIEQNILMANQMWHDEWVDWDFTKHVCVPGRVRKLGFFFFKFIIQINCIKLWSKRVIFYSSDSRTVTFCDFLSNFCQTRKLPRTVILFWHFFVTLREALLYIKIGVILWAAKNTILEYFYLMKLVCRILNKITPFTPIFSFFFQLFPFFFNFSHFFLFFSTFSIFFNFSHFF